MSKTVSLETALDLIESGATLAVCGAGGVQEPDLLLRGLLDRFDRTGTPRDLTEIHPIRTGETDGRGTTIFGRPGLIRKMIGGSIWPVGVPELVSRIHSNEIEAYNLPIGVLYGLFEAIAAGRPGLVTKIGLGTCFDPEQGGGGLNSISTASPVSRIEIDGETYLFYRAFGVDVALIRATTSDENGNLSVEDEPAVCGLMALAQAARSSGGKVIAQVRQVVPNGAIAPHAVRVPGILVDAVVEHPDQWQTTRHRYQASAVGREVFDLAEVPKRPSDANRVVLRRALMEARAGEVVAIGFGLPAYLPALALEEGRTDEITFTIEHGVIGGINGIAAGGSTFPMAQNPEAIIDAADQLRLYAGGGVDRAFLGVGEIDAAGNVNVGKFGDRIPGAGGFVEITQGIRRIVFCTALGERGMRKIVPKVQQISFSATEARRIGTEVVYVTEKAVFALGTEGLTVTEIAPGLDIERDLIADSGVRVAVSETVRTMPSACFDTQT